MQTALPKQLLPLGLMDGGPRWTRVHAFRGLPQELGGGGMRHVGRQSERVYKCRNARVGILKFIQRHLGHQVKRLHELWKEPLEIQRVCPREGYETSDDTDRLTDALKGHMLGSIPGKYTKALTIPGCPQHATRDEIIKTKQTAEADRLEADLILHTKIMSKMRASPHKQTKILAAQCLSQSCRNSGPILQAFRKYSRDRMADGHFVPFLRMRFGIPPISPAPPTRCRCKSQSRGDRGSSLADEPLHPLVCGFHGRHIRVIRRHNAIVYSLKNSLSAIPTVKATQLEPTMGSANGKRADLKVLYGGTTYLLDIGICAPGTANRVQKLRSHERPGVAGNDMFKAKTNKYKDDIQPGYIHLPFIIETGGRVHEAARRWLDAIAADPDIMQADQRIHRVYREIGHTLVHRQSQMLYDFMNDLSTDCTNYYDRQFH